MNYLFVAGAYGVVGFSALGITLLALDYDIIEPTAKFIQEYVPQTTQRSSGMISVLTPGFLSAGLAYYLHNKDHGKNAIKKLIRESK